MRLLVKAAAVVCLAFPMVVAQDAKVADATTSDANHHKVEFENDQVRVVRYKIAPHEKTAMHSHPNNVQVMLTDHNLKVTMPDGKTTEAHGKAGQTAWRTPTTHMVENIGDQPVEGLLIEPKK
jgi:quercetin dioxygenase-like cupin family protein